MIYFDNATKTRLVDKIFANAIKSKGYLFVGHTESLLGNSKEFEYGRVLKAPVYQKN